MKNLLSVLCGLLAGFFLFFVPVPELSAEPGDVELSAILNAQYKVESFSGSGSNAFELTRFYCIVNAGISQSWGLAFMSDLSLSGGSDPAYELFARHAYIRGEKKVDDMSVTFRFGLVPTPVIEHTTMVSDFHWVHPDFFEQSKSLTGEQTGSGGKTLDVAADLGVRFDLTLKKMIILTGMLNNGEGYRNINSKDRGKNFYIMLTLSPWEKVFFSGFLKRNMADFDVDKNYDSCVGLGMAWKGEFIKTGFNLGSESGVDYGAITSSILLFDGWLVIDTEPILEVPIILYGRFAMAKDYNGDGAATTFTGLGIGYRFGKNIRILCYLENYLIEDSYNNRIMYFKAEAAF